MTSHSIQTQIVNCCAKETIKGILEELGDGYFSILVDESQDVSCKQQMALVLRYVCNTGVVKERLVGVEHVSDTSSLSLKKSIYSILSSLSLSPSRIWGQGYDGASNMRGHINGLRSSILEDCSSAHYVHCFAHQLQLTLVTVAHGNDDIGWLVELVQLMLTVIGGSYKRRDQFRDKQAMELEEALEIGETQTGRGLNQELGLARPGDTRWGSHYKSFLNVILMFGPMKSVLEAIGDHSTYWQDRVKAKGILDSMQSFHFAFLVHFMRLVLSITNELSKALQRRDEDIVNAMSLLATAKKHLQKTRESGWDSLITMVNAFCEKHDIVIPSMDDLYVGLGQRGSRRASTLTYKHHYRVDVFYSIIDMQMQELNSRFPEASTELLLGVACLNPACLFRDFDETKLLRMAELYPSDFDVWGLERLRDDLSNFINHVRDDERFSNLKGIVELSMKLVETGLHLSFRRVYLLVKLALLLPVSAATVERVLSAMKLIKTNIHHRMSDEFLNDAVITYFEDDVFQKVSNEAIIDRFKKMHDRQSDY